VAIPVFNERGLLLRELLLLADKRYMIFYQPGQKHAKQIKYDPVKPPEAGRQKTFPFPLFDSIFAAYSALH